MDPSIDMSADTRAHLPTHLPKTPPKQLAKTREQLVPFPMDLATLHVKLQAKRYRTVARFHRDVELLFCGRERLLHGQGAAALQAQLLHLAGYYRSLYLEWVVGEGGDEWAGEAGAAARAARDGERRERLAVCWNVAVEGREAEALLAGPLAEARQLAEAAAAAAAAAAAEADSQAPLVAYRLEQLEGLCKGVLAGAPGAGAAASSLEVGVDAASAAAAAAAAGGGTATVRELWLVVEGMPAESPVRGVVEQGLHRMTAGVRERALRGSGAWRGVM
jgi:hypothetical protein